jgi:hypothetical protein
MHSKTKHEELYEPQRDERSRLSFCFMEKEFFEEKSCSEIEEVFVENMAELSDYGKLCF